MLRATRAPVVAAVAAATLIAASAGAAAGVHFQPESVAAFQKQLRRHEVHAVVFHQSTGTGHIHVALDNGRHMTIPYAPSEQAGLVAQARALNAPVTVAVAKPKAPVHHTLRYIAGGVLIVVILIVLAVLLAGRRRRLAEEAAG